MKKLAVLALVVVIVSLVGSGSANGDGGTGVAYVLVGRQGVIAPDRSVRYVALTTGRKTIVSVVRVRGGQVIRWRIVPGYVGVPVITLDGRPEGISRDGTTLLLADAPNPMSTRFAVIDTRSLRLRLLNLRGPWSFDALSPDGSKLFLVEYLRSGVNAPYRVRLYDLRARRLAPEPVVDRREAEKLMRGRPVTRAMSGDGRWAYTLYARARAEPFVHALDTVRARAFCIDLPLEAHLRTQLGLRLKLSGARLVVQADRGRVAVVNTDTFEVREL